MVVVKPVMKVTESMPILCVRLIAKLKTVKPAKMTVHARNVKAALIWYFPMAPYCVKKTVVR